MRTQRRRWHRHRYHLVQQPLASASTPSVTLESEAAATPLNSSTVRTGAVTEAQLSTESSMTLKVRTADSTQ